MEFTPTSSVSEETRDTVTCQIIKQETKLIDKNSDSLIATGFQSPVHTDDVIISDGRKMESDHSDCGEDHCNVNNDNEGGVFVNQHDDGDHGDESNHSFDEASKVYIVTSMVDDDETNSVVKTVDEEQPKRTLFGPPCWKPEQLMQAIDAVKNGYSLTEAGKLFGIPRTTLSNKIYGRKRRRTKPNASKSSTDESSFNEKFTPPSETKVAHNIKLNINVEIMLSNFIAKQKQTNLSTYVLTHTIFDLIRHFGKPKANIVFSDDYMKNWIRYFFIRHPKSRFELCTSQNSMSLFENQEKSFVEFVMEHFELKERVETIKAKLFELIKETYHIENVNSLWWYYLLKKYTKLKSVFVKNLQWSETIYDDTLLHGDLNCSIKVALTELTLASNHEISPMQESRLEELRTLNYAEGNSFDHVSQQTHLNKIRRYQSGQSLSRSSESTNPRFHEDMSSGNDELLDNLSEYTECNSQLSKSNITKTKSLKETLACEGLKAVERKLSTDELKYFNFRYANPHLEEAYDVWRNLKSASCVKPE